MRGEQTTSHEEIDLGSLESKDDHLSVGDLIQYLSRLERLYKDDKTGNPKLSEGLRELVKALRPYMRWSVVDLMGALGEEKRSSRDNFPSEKSREPLPPDLETIPCDGIENVIGRKYSKVQLVELGVRRFRISRSKLMRLDREGVLASIRSALDHEVSLDVISREARRVR